jgi:hypothetical protein
MVRARRLRWRFWWAPRDVRESLIEHELAIIEMQEMIDLFDKKFKEHMDMLGGKL